MDKKTLNSLIFFISALLVGTGCLIGTGMLGIRSEFIMQNSVYLAPLGYIIYVVYDKVIAGKK